MEILNKNRSKLINAVLFFTQNTKHTNTTKLMKLLYFFDFDHFKETGYPAIGLKYFAFENGPVPKKFWLEIKDDNMPPDLKLLVESGLRPWGRGNVEKVFFPKKDVKVDFSVFTPREIKILERTAEIYRDATARDMSEVSHEEKLPWEITINEKGKNQEIDYLSAITEESQILREDAQEDLQDYFSTLRAFKAEPVE